MRSLGLLPERADRAPPASLSADIFSHPPLLLSGQPALAMFAPVTASPRVSAGPDARQAPGAVEARKLYELLVDAVAELGAGALDELAAAFETEWTSLALVRRPRGRQAAALRAYEKAVAAAGSRLTWTGMTLETGKPVWLGPADFLSAAVRKLRSSRVFTVCCYQSATGLRRAAPQ